MDCQKRFPVSQTNSMYQVAGFGRGSTWLEDMERLPADWERDPRGNRVTRCVPRSRRGCKNSEKIWWMMKFLNTETSHASSSHEASNGGAVPRAENFGDLMTADHKVLSEGCESRNNHRYAIVVQPNGSSRIRVKQKLHRKHHGASKSSWSQIGNLKSFTLTIPWNLAMLVKIFPGIIIRRHHTDRKQMGLLREQCEE